MEGPAQKQAQVTLHQEKRTDCTELPVRKDPLNFYPPSEREREEAKKRVRKEKARDIQQTTTASAATTTATVTTATNYCIIC